tara:strand:+ start:36054 stop:36374 length:321 start_codon:yes stop_codon:yes gene_type:complete
MTENFSKKLSALAGLVVMVILNQNGIIALAPEAMHDITYAVIAYLLGQSVVDLGVYTTREKATAASNVVLDRIANGEFPPRRYDPVTVAEPDVELDADFPKDPLEN